MNLKKNILVFPCGSEIGLEIHRSLKYSTHFNLIGGSSVDDHGRFIFEQYIENIPFHDAQEFIDTVKQLVVVHKIDAIYPTMDAVARTLKNNQDLLGCLVIGSPAEATAICASKKLTYEKLNSCVPIATLFSSVDDPDNYPLFIKPDVGYGSRNVFLAKNVNSAREFLKEKADAGDFLICEYLPGEEFTIDCFSDRHGNLLFSGARKRVRISNGISVNTTQTDEYNELFTAYAEAINRTLKPRGAWFFQMKLDQANSPKLLEVAARLGGSSSLFRSKGVNFALLSAFDCFDMDVEILLNEYDSELDRALSNKYKLNIDFQNVYVDYDDCLLLGDKVNHEMVAFIFSARNQGKKITLITRHLGDLDASLKKYRLYNLFDEVKHITNKDKKSEYVIAESSIFIDDSHAERVDVKRKHGIPVFSPDMIEALII
jgi:ATP-grasp in the biosynthetic pathway with Ter operon